MESLDSYLEDLLPQAIYLRHALHQQPELAYNELGTAQYIFQFISDQCSLEPLATGLGGCGLLYKVPKEAAGDSENNDNPLLLIAHLDAFPLQEMSNVDWASEKAQICHGNGNDGHCVSLALLIVLLARHPELRNLCQAPVYALFQSASLLGDGSSRTLQDMEEFNFLKNCRIFCLINNPKQTKGTMTMTQGLSASIASVGIEVTMVGTSTNAASPKAGSNPILPLSSLAEDVVERFNSDHGNTDRFTLVTLVSLHADTTSFGKDPVGPSFTSAAGQGQLRLTLRALTWSRLKVMREWVEKQANKLVLGTSLTTYVVETEAFEEAVNSEICQSHVKRAAEGASLPFVVNNEPLTASMDVWRYLRASLCGGAIVCCGAGDDVPPLQDPMYDFPDDILEPLVRMSLSLCHTQCTPLANDGDELPDISSLVVSPYNLARSPTAESLLSMTVDPRPNPVMGDVLPHANCILEIDRAALKANALGLSNYFGDDVTMVAVVKANAYGMGVPVVVPILESCGVKFFAVANPVEGAACCPVFTSPDSSVQIMSPISDPMDAAWAVSNRSRVQPWVGTDAVWRLLCSELDRELESIEGDLVPLKVHVEVETGLHRTGLDAKGVLAVCSEIKAHPLAELVGICTHLAGAEMTINMPRCEKQVEVFHQVLELLGPDQCPPYLHVASSSAAILVPAMRFSMVRLGVSILGHWPTPEVRLRYELARVKEDDGFPPLELHPVLSWRSSVIHVHHAPDSEFVGYGLSRQLEGPTAIAVVPVGYSDGFSTQLSNVGQLLIHGRRCTILGHVNMSVIMVNVTHLIDPPVEVGDPVILIGKQGDSEIQVSSFAEHSFVNYELLSRLSRDIPRIVVGYDDDIFDEQE